MQKGEKGERREKAAEKRKGKERIPSSGSRKGCEQIQQMYPFIWYQFMVTFSMVTFSTLHPSFHHRSTLAPPASHHPSITFTQPLQPYPSLPPTLPPTPFHLLHPLSASFSFVGGERGGQEAVEKRRGKAQRIPRGGKTLAHAESNEKHTLYIACDTKSLGPPYAL